MKYHHLGIPTGEIREGERYLEEFDMHISGFEESPFGIEWMRFGPDCQLPEIVQTVPHIAFEVDDLEEAIAGKEVIIEANSPSPGITVAFIVDNGAPVEFLQIDELTTQNHNIDFTWQSRYYDHIIRSERALEKIRQYILNNPAKWAFDKMNLRHR